MALSARHLSVQSPKDRRHHGRSRSMGSNDPGTDHPVSGAHTQARQITVFSLGQVFFEIRPAAPAAFPGDSKRKFCWFISCIGSRRCFFRLYFAGPLCFHPGGISLASRTIIKMLRHRVVQIQEPYNGRDTWNLRQVFATDFLHSCFFFQDKIDTECKYAMTEIIGMVDPVARQIHKRLPFQQPLP